MSVGSAHRDGKNWRYAFQFNGKRVQKGGFDTRKAAMKAMEARKETLLSVGGDLKRNEFMEAYREYLAEMQDENAPSWWRNKVIYGKYFKKHFGAAPVHAVSEFDVNRYKHARNKNGSVATGTVDKELATLKHFFGWAVRKGYCATNPAAQVKKFNDDNRRGVSLSRDDARRLIANASPDMRLRILLALGFGLRIGEIAAIKLDDIDYCNNTIRIMREKKRRKEPVALSAPPELMMLIRNLRCAKGDRNRYLFPAETCYKRWNRLLVKVGLPPDIRFHDLRHTAASWQLEDGQNIEAIRRFLGHRSVTTTECYLHVEDDTVRAMSTRTLNGLL